MARRFDASYRETVTLHDGASVELRPVRPDDKPAFLDGFARLSRESRFLRFFTGKDHLSADELRYLTEVDGELHFALCAIAAGDVGVGVARFVRQADEPEVAELAVTVVDAWQHKGLGRILLERLVEAARERGVARFRAEILASNAPMLALLEGQVATREQQGSELLVELPLPELYRPGPLAQLLQLAARRLLSFRRVFDRRGS
jgi:GNAT superfamily N-acetyltransferase